MASDQPLSPARRCTLISSALAALHGPSVSITRLDPDQASHPGLYACYGSAATWKQLGLGKPPDGRPLYVGKAENTLAARDVEGHFGLRERGRQSPTGSSTLRRSLASLLASDRGYPGIPRNPDKPGYFSNVTTTNRIYRYVLQRRQRGEIGRRRQLAMNESAADLGRSKAFSTRTHAC